MKFMALKNADTDKLAALLVQDSSGKIHVASYNKWTETSLRAFLTGHRFFDEIRVDDRTVVKKQVLTTDPSFFDLLKTRVRPPFLPYMSGVVDAVTSSEALSKVWPIFSPKQISSVMEI